MRLHDPARGAHGDFLVIARNRANGAFTIALDRLFQTEEDALAAMPKTSLATDILICEVQVQHRPRIIFDEIIDARVPLLSVVKAD